MVCFVPLSRGSEHIFLESVIEDVMQSYTYSHQEFCSLLRTFRRIGKAAFDYEEFVPGMSISSFDIVRVKVGEEGSSVSVFIDRCSKWAWMFRRIQPSSE